MVSLRLRYDADVDVAYLSLQETSAVLGPTLLLEHDDAFPGAVALDFSLGGGRVVGIEFEHASRCLAPELLALADPADNVRDRMLERVLRRLLAAEDTGA